MYAKSVPVGASAVTCTYTNTRKKVAVTVQKQYIGTPTTVELYVGANEAECLHEWRLRFR